VLGSRSRALARVPEFTFAGGMTVVVQPNVVTPDQRAGVQTGELLLVPENGVERLHSFERGLLRAPGQRRGVSASTANAERLLGVSGAASLRFLMPA
jgi:hypothetical protein